MTGSAERDGAAGPLSGMGEAAPDDLFVSRSKPARRAAGAQEQAYGADDDLYGGPTAISGEPDELGGPGGHGGREAAPQEPGFDG